jgi:hypothetical protein
LRCHSRRGEHAGPRWARVGDRGRGSTTVSYAWRTGDGSGALD